MTVRRKPLAAIGFGNLAAGQLRTGSEMEEVFGRLCQHAALSRVQ